MADRSTRRQRRKVRTEEQRDVAKDEDCAVKIMRIPSFLDPEYFNYMRNETESECNQLLTIKLNQCSCMQPSRDCSIHTPSSTSASSVTCRRQ